MEPEIIEETAAPEENEAKEVDQGRTELVNSWLDKIASAKKHYEPVFKAMKTSQDFAMRGATKAWRESGAYTVPILPRYINQTVSTLYARNPKTIYKRRKRLEYQLWDGREDTLQASMRMAQMGDPNAMSLLQEVLAVRQKDMMLDRMGETLQLLWQYFLDEQGANYKQQLKAAVRRAKICKVAYIKLGYQRMLEPRPEMTAKIEDVTSKIASIEYALKEMAEDEEGYAETTKEMEQLRLNLADLEKDRFITAREGPVLDFPKSDQIIVDPKCTHLKSFSGARWVAHQFEMQPCDIEKVWKVDIEDQFTPYSQTESGKSEDVRALDKDACARVYEVWDKENMQVFVVCEGHKDFIKEPATPQVWMERFWPFFPIVFNEVEHDEELYPLSDVEQAKDIQEEYNRSREALREHRIAARPYWIEGVGMEDDEKKKLASHAAHEVISMPTLGTGQKIADILQRGPTAPIDPNLYELESHFQDLLRVVGYQEAQIGATSGSTATESSIAQQAQSASQSDNVDDLDETLGELARAGGQVMLLNVQLETVKEYVGEGAVWPDTETTREAAAKELYLEIEASSSGRPNKAADLANMERGMPYIMQMPSINPMPIAKKYLMLLDIDVDESIAEGVPSITAINAIMSKAGANPGGQPTGDPQSDPNAQGEQGGQNAPNPQSNEPGPQPGYPA